MATRSKKVRKNPDRPAVPDERRRFIHTNGLASHKQDIREAAKALRRAVRFRDIEGYDHEIVAAALDPDWGRVAIVECTQKRVEERGVDISFYLRIRAFPNWKADIELETYNPYFGCRVRFFRWLGDSVLLVYDEKHETYACRWGAHAPARFVVIGNDFAVGESTLGFKTYGEDQIRRLELPSLTELAPVPLVAAAAGGCWSPKPTLCC